MTDLPGMLVPLGQGPVAHAFLVLPIMGLSLIIVAAHALSLAKAEMPASRRRIRLASAMVMMLMLPIGSYALSLADPVRDQRAFVLAWMLTTGLVVMLLALAGLDLLNTWRLHRRDLRTLRRTLRESLRDARDEAASRTLPGR
ncbi:MAG: hypothetical protein SFY69_12195 [Planctomycetota bacterium]|nr:hypothetical protein [Planctomycetota bacterium]